MDFFESLREPPPPPPSRPPRPVWAQPEFVLPGSVAEDLVIVRTDHLAVMIGSIRAYPTGFEFTVDTRVRQAPEPGRPGAEAWLHPDMGEGALRIGLLYADGRRGASTEMYHAPGDDLESDRLLMLPGGGGGNYRSWHLSYWIYPLPPPGPVAFYAEWPEHDIAEAHAEIDGGLIRDAAGRAIALWPEPEGEELPGSSSTTVMVFTADPPDPSHPADPS
jgi:hypothetical protein